MTTTQRIAQWVMGMISDTELLHLLATECNTHGAIEKGRFTRYDYTDQRWITEAK